MHPTEPITIRAAKQTVAKLDAIAAAMDRSRNYIVKQAIDDYLAYHQALLQKVHKGIAEADQGKLTPHDKVFAKLDAKRKKQSR